MPEAELTEQITTAGRLKLVTAIASGVCVTPLVVLGIAIVLALVAWLLGKKAPFPALFSASAVGLLPVALQRALWGVVALSQLGITEERARHLLPSSLGAWVHSGPKLSGLLDSLDLFQLAAALLIGVGFAAATGIRRRSGMWVGLVLFAAYVGVFGVGIPGLVGGGGDPGTGRVRVGREVADERPPPLRRPRRHAHHPPGGPRGVPEQPPGAARRARPGAGQRAEAVQHRRADAPESSSRPRPAAPSSRSTETSAR